MIELGRYNQTTRDNRNCTFCGSNQIEDEIHFEFFLIVLNALWLGIIFKIKFKILSSKYYPITCERFDQWTVEHI